MTEYTEQLGMNELDIDEENEYIKDMACAELDAQNWWNDINEDSYYG
jgi:hypothetical protein